MARFGRTPERCLAPTATWRQRHTSLRDAIALTTERFGSSRSFVPFVAFVDLDALAPRGHDDWRSDRSFMMSSDIYRLVLDAVEQGGWFVYRTCPTTAVSADLADMDVEVTYPGESDDVEELRPFAPEVRPTAAWLVQRGVVGRRDLSRIVTDVGNFDAHVIDLAYGALSTSARDAGKLLSAVRPPQRANGAFGAFDYADGPPTARTLSHRTAHELRESGFLQADTTGCELRMPRLVRDALARFATMGVTSELEQLHKKLAVQSLEGLPTEQKIEIHHHAVLAGDVGRAKETARFYGADLRALATDIGLDAKRLKRDNRPNSAAKLFREAADLFEYIVEHFDAQDAYAWEYHGYNLAHRRHDPADRERAAFLRTARTHSGAPTRSTTGACLGFADATGTVLSTTSRPASIGTSGTSGIRARRCRTSRRLPWVGFEQENSRTRSMRS